MFVRSQSIDSSKLCSGEVQFHEKKIPHDDERVYFHIIHKQFSSGGSFIHLGYLNSYTFYYIEDLPEPFASTLDAMTPDVNSGVHRQ